VAPGGDIIRPVSTRRQSWLENWRERHRSPLSRGLHYVGIPLTVAAGLLAVLQLCQWRWDLWWRPALLVGVGYLLQYAGHCVEGNDMGEVILIKKLLGRPYQALSPHQADRQKGRSAGPGDRV
jgi:hypothetical protein